jgi:predicted N-acyltransferase
MSQKTLISKIYEGIKQVPPDIWDSLAEKSSITYSTKYWKIIEDSKISGFYNFTYIIIFSDNKPIGIASCYIFNEDLGKFTKGILKKLITFIRRFFPNFIMLKVLECGAPINIHSPPFILNTQIDKANIILLINKTLHKIARKNKTFIIGIKDLDLSFIFELKINKYTIINSTPNSYLNIKWKSISEYCKSMKSYYRSKLNNHLRKNTARNINCNITGKFSMLSEDLFKHWLTVYNNAEKLNREILNPRFYNLLSSSNTINSKVILFYIDGKLIGHALLILDNKILRWLYVGREKTVKDSLYIYIMYKVIETGINLGMEQIDCGATTYSIKQDLGADITRLYYAVKFDIPIINFFAKYFFRMLENKNIPKNKNIFKENL